MSMTESDVEGAAIEWLQEIAYDCVHRNTRDALLPKLVNGEIRVGDVEELL